MNACRLLTRYLLFIVPFLLATACNDDNTPCVPDNHLPIALADFDLGDLYAGDPVHFFDRDSYDPGGVILVKYQWDWNNDGVWDESGRAVTHTWSAPGTYYVMFGVTSADGETDTLDLPLEVLIGPVPAVE